MAQLTILAEPGQAGRERGRVARRIEQPVDAVVDQLEWATRGGRDDGHAGRHPFDDHLAERLRNRGSMDEHVETVEHRGRVLDKPREVDAVAEALARDELVQLGEVLLLVRAEERRTDDQSLRIGIERSPGERLDERVLSLPPG